MQNFDKFNKCSLRFVFRKAKIKSIKTFCKNGPHAPASPHLPNVKREEHFFRPLTLVIPSRQSLCSTGLSLTPFRNFLKRFVRVSTIIIIGILRRMGKILCRFSNCHGIRDCWQFQPPQRWKIIIYIHRSNTFETSSAVINCLNSIFL